MTQSHIGDTSGEGGLHSAEVHAEGVALHYLEWNPAQQGENSILGGDELRLVMLHGLGATADTWRLMAPYLCRQHPVVAFDLRGHGESEQPESGYDLGTVAEDVVHGMAALGLGKV